MQKVVDIRPLKQKLRREIKAWRAALPPEEKQRADERIFRRIVSLREYAACGLVISYVSLPIEVDTLALINRALADGKRVAAPRCVEGSREMEFYYIRSPEDLAPQTFGVLEPIKERCELVREFGKSICIVPALAYDRTGVRLGYGAGYYDRFLAQYQGVKIGVVYERNLLRGLWSGKYDVPVELVVTERRLHVCADRRGAGDGKRK